MVNHIPRTVALVIAVLIPGACAHPSGSSSGARGQQATVTGSVAYRERVALPPDATMDIHLYESPRVTDASGDSVPQLIGGGGEIASATVSAEGRQVPLPFTLRYDPARIRKDRLYVLSASIKGADGEVLFTSSIHRSVITQGNPSHVDLVLSRPIEPTAITIVVGSKWILEELNGTPVLDDAAPTLEFPEQGKAAGFGSCNRFFGTVNISGSSISFGALGSTRMACGTAISLQEVDYFGALESAHRFTIESATRGGVVLSIYGSRFEKPLRFRAAIRVRS